MVLVHMAGEISPDMMFCMGWQKVAKMGAGGYRSVRMGQWDLWERGERETAKQYSKLRANGNIWPRMIIAPKLF